MALQLQPVNSFTEKWQRCSKQTMCQAQSAVIKADLLTIFTCEGRGTITNALASNRASLHLVNVLGETSLIFLPSSSEKVMPALFKAHACEE